MQNSRTPSIRSISVAVVLGGAAASMGAIVPVGNGSYCDTLPSGLLGPTNSTGASIRPAYGPDWNQGAAPTNDWASSLVFQRTTSNPHPYPMFAHPWVIEASSAGLVLGSGPDVAVGTTYFAYGTAWDISVAIPGSTNAATTLDGATDWTVTASLYGGSLKATFGHGLPFVYVQRSGTIELDLAGTPADVRTSGARIAFDVGTRHYAAWAPSSCTWTASGQTLSTDLGSAGYLSIAVLPDNTSSTLAAFDAHAYAFVTDTRVSWSLDTVSGRVLTDFVTTTTAKEGSNTVPLVGLYPHQWRRAVGLAPLGPSYPTARGTLELSATNSFRTSAPLPAIFPIVPFAAPRNAHYRASRLDSLLTVWSSKSDAALVRRNADTYWTGKDLGRLVQLMELASAAGDTVQRDRFLTLLRTRLEGWLTYTSGKSAEYFAHEPAWGTLLGASTSYGSGEELNDHHFHYGYFLMAAAAVAAHVPGWGDSTAWGGMVDLVAKDVANPQRNQAFSPFLRNFDPYEGHSWASGHANFGDGNNEESSSEAINFSAGLALWGESSGNRTLRDLGTWMYATETDATREYWFDVHGDNFPSSWTHDVAGMIWGGKADHGTWFSAEPEDIHGINWLPVTGGSLYLGLDSAAAKANHDEMVAEKSGSLGIWLDIVWEQQAFFAPENAWTNFDAASATYTPEDGESQAHTMAHILSLGVLGRLDTAVHGDIPSSTVFRNASAVDHVAWNPTSTSRVVSFTDGQKLTVAPHSWAWSDGSTSLSTAKSRPASLESALYDIRGRHRASGTASGIGLSTNGSKAQVR